MRKALLLLTTLPALWLVGCSGGPGTKVSVHVENSRGEQAFPLAVAYRIADGDWAWLSPDQKATYSFYVPQGKERYGLAVRCPRVGMMVGPAPVRIYELTLSDTADPVVVCQSGAPKPPFVRVTVHGDVSAVNGAQAFSVVSEVGSRYANNVQKDVMPWMIREPGRDLLLLACSTNTFPCPPDDLLAARVFRGIEPEEGLELSLSLTNADAVGTAQVGPVTLPAGWTAGYYYVTLQTRNSQLGQSLGHGATGGGTYRTVSGLAESDLYVFSTNAWVSDPGGTRRSLAETRWVPAVSAGDLQAELPAAFAESYAPDLGGELARFGLDYSGAGTAAFSFSVTSNDNVTTKAWVSPAWLAGLDAYTMPDLTGVPGFSNAVTRAGEVANWTACAIQSSMPLSDLITQPHGEDLSPTVYPGGALDHKAACIEN